MGARGRERGEADVAALRIGELLIEEGLITPAQLKVALSAQQIFGGRLGTNLVEHGFVNEVDLARVLARQLGIGTVDPQDLAEIDRRIIDLVPPDVATKYSVVPFRHDETGDRLALAVADPGNLQKIDELQFALGKRIDFHVSPEIMLSFALEKYYGVERRRRYIRIGGVADAELQLVQARRGQSTAVSATGSPAERTLARIVGASTKPDLIAAVVDGLAEASEQLVFLAASGTDLIGWEARGLPVGTDALRSVSLPLGDSPLAQDLFQTFQDRLVSDLGEDPLRHVLESSLFLDCSRPVYLLPLIANRRAFGLFAFGQLEEGPFMTGVPTLVELVKRVGYKLQIFYLQEQLEAKLP